MTERDDSALARVWLTPKEVRVLTRRSLTTIYAALQDGELEGGQKGRNKTWRIHRDAVDRWMYGDTKASA